MYKSMLILLNYIHWLRTIKRIIELVPNSVNILTKVI